MEDSKVLGLVLNGMAGGGDCGVMGGREVDDLEGGSGRGREEVRGSVRSSWVVRLPREVSISRAGSAGSMGEVTRRTSAPWPN